MIFLIVLRRTFYDVHNFGFFDLSKGVRTEQKNFAKWGFFIIILKDQRYI